MKKQLMALAAAGVLLATPVGAHHAGERARAGDIVVSHAWTEEVGAMAHAVEVYVTIENLGTDADRLVGASTVFTQPAVFQATVIAQDGTVMVREVPAVEIAGGQSVTFQPGGLRIVLNDVQRPLQAGGHFDMTLTFEGAGSVGIEVEIEPRDDSAEPPAA